MQGTETARNAVGAVTERLTTTREDLGRVAAEVLEEAAPAVDAERAVAEGAVVEKEGGEEAAVGVPVGTSARQY